jgi:hypothetical protein
MKPRSIAVLLASICLVWTTPAGADVVTNWNLITMNCVGGVPPNIPAGRGGPTGVIDIALVQAAVHDAVQAIEGRFESYRYVNRARLGSGSPEAAAAAAAHSTLTGLYGSSHACLNGVQNPATTYPGDPGLQAGYKAADELLRYKRPAFMTDRDPFFGGTEPGEWRPAPGVTTGGANVYMGETEPFTLLSPRQFRPEPPPPLDSQHYARDYDEVKRLGSLTGSERTPEQLDLARFWGNFGGQWFGTLRSIADEHLPDISDKARLLALASLAAADSQITVYETKYYYNFWRPVTAIREGDNDGNPNTVGDTAWTSFLPTPPYPDHSSGANNITGAITTILQLFFGTDEFDFSVSSTAANLLVNPRTYERFSDAQQEVVDVRIYQGIHFRFADEDGRQQGARVAHWAFQKFLRPLPGAKK